MTCAFTIAFEEPSSLSSEPLFAMTILLRLSNEDVIQSKQLKADFILEDELR